MLASHNFPNKLYACSPRSPSHRVWFPQLCHKKGQLCWDIYAQHPFPQEPLLAPCCSRHSQWEPQPDTSFVSFLVLGCTVRPSRTCQWLWARSEHPSAFHLWTFWNFASFARFTTWLDLHCTSTSSQHDSQGVQCWGCVRERERETEKEAERSRFWSYTVRDAWAESNYANSQFIHETSCVMTMSLPLQPPDCRHSGSWNLDQQDFQVSQSWNR